MFKCQSLLPSLKNPSVEGVLQDESKNGLHVKHPLTTRLVPTTHVLNATENISMKCRENPSSMNDVQPVRKPHFKGVKKRKWIYDEPKNFPGSGMRRAVHIPNPKHKMSYHHHNKNRNAENASYTHAQRDAVRTVTLNAPPRSRPTSGSYNKADVNKEPKLNLCPVINICQHHIMVQPGEEEFLFQKRIRKLKRYIQSKKKWE
ncbi:hypothetical protein APTSU1_001076900 [Apodemus speciosus]|uniref:Uncharacterized protein n=1 Tax=Apodemus speciosus TaxID=105296 RepID=A0ABQ0F8Q0_APOSI